MSPGEFQIGRQVNIFPVPELADQLSACVVILFTITTGAVPREKDWIKQRHTVDTISDSSCERAYAQGCPTGRPKKRLNLYK